MREESTEELMLLLPWLIVAELREASDKRCMKTSSIAVSQSVVSGSIRFFQGPEEPSSWR